MKDKVAMRRKLKYGSFATALTVFVILIAFVINLVATGLSSRFGITLDLTENSLFKITSETKEYLQDLQRDVVIYVLYEEYSYRNADQQTALVLDSYAQSSSRISVHYEDIISNPGFVNMFPDSADLKAGDIVIFCSENGKMRKVSQSDIYQTQTNYTTGTQYNASVAEQTLTSALLAVTSDSQLTVSVLTGHNDTDPTGLVDLLTKNNYEVKMQILATEEIDPETDIIILFGPTRDLSDESIKKIETFLDNDGMHGKLLYYFAASDPSLTALPNLDALLRDWGISVDNESFVYETSVNRVVGYTPLYLVADIASAEQTPNIVNKNLLYAIIYGRPLEQVFETKGSYTTKSFVNYSSTAALLPAFDETHEISDDDIVGESFPAVLASMKLTYDGMDPLRSFIVAVSSTDSFDASVLAMPSIANAEYIMELTNYMVGNDEVIYITPKDLSSKTVVLTDSQKVWISRIFIYVIPVIVMILGAVVWLRRRHR